jgi:D-amino-acid oxidase
MRDVVVIGSGVSGLTTAVRLAEAGLTVTIWTAEPSQKTTSAAAGAMWGPYLVEPVDKVLDWSRRSLGEFTALAAQPGTGIRITPGIEAARHPMDRPVWGDLTADLHRCHDLPEGFIDGFRFTVPLLDMPVYLSYLEHRFLRAGGVIEIRTVKSLGEATAAAGVIVNCAGMGARAIAPDPDLRPIRGQFLVVANPGIEEFFSEDTGLSPDLCCIYPHGDVVVLGGTAEDGAWDLQPDPQTAEQILNRCAAIVPALAAAHVISHRVGLRPTRSAVRVEEDTAMTGARLIHNYGHGGAGVTLSWGCADSVMAMISVDGDSS